MAEWRELSRLTQVSVRVDPAGGAARRLGLPPEPNTARAAGARRTLWLGPDEWLVVGSPEERPGLESELREALGYELGAVVDVSAQRMVIELSGPDSRDVLMQGCSIDLHPRVFHEGRCAQTMLAQAQVILLPVSPQAYWVFVRSSFTGYMEAWLRDALHGAELST
jgi:sarcosine oxidase subunit gamma